MKMADSRTQLL